MFPISGFSHQISSGAPPRDAQQGASADAPAPEPQDTFLPSEGLDGSTQDLSIGDRGALIRRDLKDKDFILKETENFKLYYLPGTAAEIEIEEIAGKREEGYGIITGFLKTEVPEKISIYLFPSDRESYCPTWGKTFAGRTIPEARMIGLAYIQDAESYEKVNFGHELTHAIEFEILPAGRRVPPFLREGIADYLCLSGLDMNVRLARFLNIELIESPLIITEEKLNAPEYMESASFVQLLLSAWGTESFLNFYRECAILRKGESMRLSTFSEIMGHTLGHTLTTHENMWRETLNPYPAAPIPPLAEEESISTLIEEMNSFTTARNMPALLSLYSGDFYYRSPQEECDLYEKHMNSCRPGETKDVRIYDLGTWTYGKTVAVKTIRMLREIGTASVDSQEIRYFIAEKIWGRWRLNPKIVGGWTAKGYCQG